MLNALPNTKTNSSAKHREQPAGHQTVVKHTSKRWCTQKQSLHALLCQTVNRSTREINIQGETTWATASNFWKQTLIIWRGKTSSFHTDSWGRLIRLRFRWLGQLFGLFPGLQVNCFPRPLYWFAHIVFLLLPPFSSASVFCFVGRSWENCGPSLSTTCQTWLKQTGPTPAHLPDITTHRRFWGYGLTPRMVHLFCLFMIE